MELVRLPSEISYQNVASMPLKIVLEHEELRLLAVAIGFVVSDSYAVCKNAHGLASELLREALYQKLQKKWVLAEHKAHGMPYRKPVSLNLRIAEWAMLHAELIEDYESAELLLAIGKIDRAIKKYNTLILLTR